jgi:fumarate hydratase class II
MTATRVEQDSLGPVNVPADKLGEAQTPQSLKHFSIALMLITALSPVIGYDKASKVAHYAVDHDLTLKQAALQLGVVNAAAFDRIVDPREWSNPTSL